MKSPFNMWPFKPSTPHTVIKEYAGPKYAVVTTLLGSEGWVDGSLYIWSSQRCARESAFKNSLEEAKEIYDRFLKPEDKGKIVYP